MGSARLAVRRLDLGPAPFDKLQRGFLGEKLNTSPLLKACMHQFNSVHLVRPTRLYVVEGKVNSFDN